MGVVGAHYTYRKGHLLYHGKPLIPELIAEARGVLSLHAVPKLTARACYESLLFCIANQASSFERPVQFMHSLHQASLEELLKPGFLESRASEAGVMYNNRFREPLDYARNHPGGIVALAAELVASPQETRRRIVDDPSAKYLAMKTVSFWHLTLGGTSLMTIDRHNCRELASIGLDVRETHYIPKKRENGKTKGMVTVTTPTKRQYEDMEKEALEKLSNETLLCANGSIDAALVTTLFWLANAKRSRRMSTLQQDLFDPVGSQLGFFCPYSPEVSPLSFTGDVPETALAEKTRLSTSSARTRS